MFIIEKPYASELLFDTILQNDWWILDNQTVRDAEIEEGALNFISQDNAVNFYQKQEYPLIYTNSDNAVEWVVENLPKSNLTSYIKTFKDKAVFRELLKDIFPDFYFKAVSLEELKSINIEEIKFPCVIKPSVGLLNIGVHTVTAQEKWKDTVAFIEKEIKQSPDLYSDSAVDYSNFIIEEHVEGKEFAIDAYYDRNGEPVILNIFQHPLLNENDVNNRIYITSAEIMIRYMSKFGIVLKQIGDLVQIKNLPIHMEVIVKEEGEIVPVEINPMRFGTWCTADIARYAWKINVYEHFYKQKRPNWNEILSKSTQEIFYYSLVEVPQNIDRNSIKNFEYEKFLANYPNVIELRRTNPNTTMLFAIVFGSTFDKHSVGKILGLNVKNCIVT